MRFIAFASDYDETLACAGRVARGGISALEALAGSGRKLLLVTGRELADLADVFPQLNLFDRIVAENGAIIYRPATRETKLLAERVPERFVEALRKRGVAPLSVGQVIVATREPNEGIVLETIRDLGLELQVVFNKGAVMVLPSGINKGSGLRRALRELGLSAHNCVGVGDAENDHAFMSITECSAAVANALPTLKDRADIVTTHEATAGVIELIEQLLADDLRRYQGRLSRHDILIGEDERGRPVRLPIDGPVVLIAEASGAGKSAIATALIERFKEQAYQYCLVDPEGDDDGLDGAVSLGTAESAPALDEVRQILANPESNCVLNLSRMHLEDRLRFVAGLLLQVEELRARCGRPAWIAIDQAHRLLPASGATPLIGSKLHSALLITVDPAQLAPEVLASVDQVIAVGNAAAATLEQFAALVGAGVPPTPTSLAAGEALLWRWRCGEAPIRLRAAESRELIQHAIERRCTGA